MNFEQVFATTEYNRSLNSNWKDKISLTQMPLKITILKISNYFMRTPTLDKTIKNTCVGIHFMPSLNTHIIHFALYFDLGYFHF